jgi:hypothetical protein
MSLWIFVVTNAVRLTAVFIKGKESGGIHLAVHSANQMPVKHLKKQ